MLSLLLHGGVILALLLVPWPASSSLERMLLLTLVFLEALRSQRRIRCWRGHFTLREGHLIGWHQRQWHFASRPWLTRQAIWVSLQDERGRRARLWLFADGMKNSEWRLLRQQLLNKTQHGSRATSY